jgi:asparagine synthase (glutamine-hydrolysing)
MGAHGAQAVIARLAQSLGVPTLRFSVGAGAVAGWKGPSDLVDRGDQGWAAEGLVELQPVDAANAKTSGDFARLTLRDSGLLLESGRAGGYRPVFVASPSRELVVACTHLAPLLRLLPYRPALDREYLAGLLLGRSPPADATPYRGVARLPLGDAWLVRPGEASTQRWSTLSTLHGPELRDDGGLALELRDAITASVRRAAQASRRAGVEVSGGLDSSLILSLLDSLARAGAIDDAPLGISYESSAPHWNDDRPFLRSLERHLGASVRRVLPHDAAAFVRQPMTIDAMPAPSAILMTVPPIAEIVQAAGAGVILSGDGGDQILDGSPRLFGELAGRGEVRRAVSGTLRTRGVFYDGPIGRLDRYLVRPLIERALPAGAVGALRRLRHRRRPRWAGRALVRSDVGRADTPRPPSLNESPGERYTRLLREIPFVPWSLLRHQKEVLGGYAVRAPLIDDDFVRFAVRLPPLSLLEGGYLRGLMREAMRTLVPEDVRLRETKGSWHWFVEQAMAAVGGLRALADLADVHKLADLGLVEPRAFRDVFDDGCHTPHHADYDELWRVLSAESFLRDYDESETVSRCA